MLGSIPAPYRVMLCKGVTTLHVSRYDMHYCDECVRKIDFWDEMWEAFLHVIAQEGAGKLLRHELHRRLERYHLRGRGRRR